MEQKIKPYDKKTESKMKYFYSSLNEKDKRHYAAIESYKLGHGGINYIAKLFGCSRQTIYSGLKELRQPCLSVELYCKMEILEKVILTPPSSLQN